MPNTYRQEFFHYSTIDRPWWTLLNYAEFHGHSCLHIHSGLFEYVEVPIVFRGVDKKKSARRVSIDALKREIFLEPDWKYEIRSRYLDNIEQMSLLIFNSSAIHSFTTFTDALQSYGFEYTGY
jgi:hypothetical protein